MPGWRNWQTRWYEVPEPRGVQVQVLSRAQKPCYNKNKMSKPRPKRMYAIVKTKSPTIRYTELYQDTDVKVERDEEMWEVEVTAVKVINKRAKKSRRV